MEEPTSKSYSIEKLNESNYRSWSQVVESHLDDQDLWEVVKGKEERPQPPITPTSAPQSSEQAATEAAAEMEEYETKLEAWTKKAKKARKMIISTISASVMTYVEGTKDPAEMWTILEGRYKPKTRVTLRQLQRQFNTMKMMDRKIFFTGLGIRQNGPHYFRSFGVEAKFGSRVQKFLSGEHASKRHNCIWCPSMGTVLCHRYGIV